MLCKTHGGGRRCAHADGCTKSAQGATPFCIAHGGGRRCHDPQCGRPAISASDFCRKHALDRDEDVDMVEDGDEEDEEQSLDEDT